jgi:hypothetical protein
MKRILFNLAKAILRSLLDETMRLALPKIYEKLDMKIPVALFNGASPKIIESEIEYTIGQVTGKLVTKEVVAIVAALYDPIKNAERTQRRPR